MVAQNASSEQWHNHAEVVVTYFLLSVSTTWAFELRGIISELTDPTSKLRPVSSDPCSCFCTSVPLSQLRASLPSNIRLWCDALSLCPLTFVDSMSSHPENTAMSTRVCGRDWRYPNHRDSLPRSL